eukprot:Phypoly_transcript_15027.p1 GENE.Phypoly_transcript_15027~~Phypoly_transcript_15027.p1  ORF type:complete len:215 (+),score=37.08 Phypoly_transcript_15027:214-858(+)
MSFSLLAGIESSITFITAGATITPAAQRIRASTPIPLKAPATPTSNNRAWIPRNSLELFQHLNGDNDWALISSLSPPRHINAEFGSNCLIITWQNPSNTVDFEEIEFVLQQKDVKDCDEELPWQTIYEGPSKEFHLIAPPKKFCFRVAAKNGSIIGDFSLPLCGTTDKKWAIFEEVSTFSQTSVDEPDEEDQDLEDESSSEDDEDFDDILARLQ